MLPWCLDERPTRIHCCLSLLQPARPERLIWFQEPPQSSWDSKSTFHPISDKVASREERGIDCGPQHPANKTQQ